MPSLGDLIYSASRIVMDQLIGYQPPLAPAILVVKKNGKKYSSYSSFVQLISIDSRIALSSYSHPVTMDYYLLMLGVGTVHGVGLLDFCDEREIFIS